MSVQVRQLVQAVQRLQPGLGVQLPVLAYLEHEGTLSQILSKFVTRIENLFELNVC